MIETRTEAAIAGEICASQALSSSKRRAGGFEPSLTLALLWQNYFCVNPETHSAAGTSFMDLHSEERLDDGSPDRRES
ncbi:MAG: hypothetical protein ACT4O2_15365, partial [Beijerinckiaceae bacterium]